MLRIGSVIDGKYKILNVIGKGGMSVVYLAMNERVNKQWAVKEVFQDESKRYQVDKKEIELMKRLKHPRLPSIIDVIEGENSLLIVMDYIEGRSLHDILLDYGARPQEEVIGWARQLCDVLSYLHSREPAVIYRDMKPANVMLKPDGSVMLIDFGAAREYKPLNQKDTVSLGTRGYAAPEQYEKAGQSDERTDIYCLGVMLFQLLTGESPHNLRPICDIDASLSPGLESILIKCTQVKKEDRYQSCSDLTYALEHYWEWDFAYQKKQGFRLLRFLLPVFLAVMLGMGAAVFWRMEGNARKNTYEGYLLAARNSVTKEDEIANYQKAVNLNPAREEAYLELLENAFLDDHVLTKEESRQLREVLIDYGNGKQTNESLFRKNRAGYDEFAYRAGIAYYYKFEEKSNKKNARAYFEVASASECLKDSQRERSRILYAISDYYSRIGIVDAAGDASITYRDYWEDLTELSAGNLVEMDNERTALVIYEELVSQMASNVSEFMHAGVEQEEMMNQLKNVTEHLSADFVGLTDQNRMWIQEELQTLSRYVESAGKRINAAFGQRDKGE